MPCSTSGGRSSGARISTGVWRTSTRGRSRPTRACGALYRRHRLANRRRQGRQGGVRGGAPLVSAGQRRCVSGGGQGLHGPGPELHRRGLFELFDLEEAIRLNLEGDESSAAVVALAEPRGHSLLRVGLAHLEWGNTGWPRNFPACLGLPGGGHLSPLALAHPAACAPAASWPWPRGGSTKPGALPPSRWSWRPRPTHASTWRAPSGYKGKSWQQVGGSTTQCAPWRRRSGWPRAPDTPRDVAQQGGSGKSWHGSAGTRR